MPQRSILPRLGDMIEAIERIRAVVAGLTLDEFEQAWDKRWLVERGLEIVSEASRHLPDELKARHGLVPWRKVADIGNVLRHAYQHVAPDILWRLTQSDLDDLEAACRSEFERARSGG